MAIAIAPAATSETSPQGAAASTAFPAATALSHPAFEPLRPWLDALRPAEHDWPGTKALNALAETSPRPPVTASGQLVRFCIPDPFDAAHYEQRIQDTGRVDTRQENLHDFFNALAWLAFPRLKAALNARHVRQLPFDVGGRGRLRDLLTLIDEGGVIVACAEDALHAVESQVRGFRWQTLFWDRRAEVLRDVRFVLVGHSAYEKALAPYPGITCKAMFVATPRSRLEAAPADLVSWLDEVAAGWVEALPGTATPRQMAPLPVFGYPGWLAGQTQKMYADRRWFRPEPAGRSAASAR